MRIHFLWFIWSLWFLVLVSLVGVVESTERFSLMANSTSTSSIIEIWMAKWFVNLYTRLLLLFLILKLLGSIIWNLLIIQYRLCLILAFLGCWIPIFRRCFFVFTRGWTAPRILCFWSRPLYSNLSFCIHTFFFWGTVAIPLPAAAELSPSPKLTSSGCPPQH